MTDTRSHLHHYIDGVCADPRAPGGPCGEKQVYRPPSGSQRFEFEDVMVDKEDLRLLLSIAVCPEFDPDGEFDLMLGRLESLLET